MPYKNKQTSQSPIRPDQIRWKADYFEAKGYKEGFRDGAWLGGFWVLVAVLWFCIGNWLRGEGTPVWWWEALPWLGALGWWLRYVVRNWKRER